MGSINGLVMGSFFMMIISTSDTKPQAIIIQANVLFPDDIINHQKELPTLPSVICRGLTGTVADPDPSVCDTYFSCHNGIPKKHFCIAGLHFDEKIGFCNLPRDAGRQNCKKSEPLIPTLDDNKIETEPPIPTPDEYRIGSDFIITSAVSKNNMTERKCQVNEFQCEDENCIQQDGRCDGDRNCADGSDEANCSNRRECRCVPLNLCCDPHSNSDNTETGLVLDNRSANQIIDIGRLWNSQCHDPLTACCETCSEGFPVPRPIPSNQCGTRNFHGVKFTVVGFHDSQAQLSEFPWMVAVLMQNNTYVGGGSLVHPRVIITAASKVQNLTARSLVVRIGAWDLNATTEIFPSQNIEVEKVLFHWGYNQSTKVYNIALLILKKKAVLSETVMPVCLPEFGQVFDNSSCIVTGWGKRVSGETGKYQEIMKKISVPAVNHGECQRMLRKTHLGQNFNLHNSFTCAGGLREDACEGDGGSPLVCPNPSNPNEYVQVGVVSWGIGCGIVGNPGVYGSIPLTVDWIKKKIQDNVGLDSRLG